MNGAAGIGGNPLEEPEIRRRAGTVHLVIVRERGCVAVIGLAPRVKSCFLLFVRLTLNPGERNPFFLRLDAAGGSPISVKEMLSKTVTLLQSKVSDRNSAIGYDVRIL